MGLVVACAVSVLIVEAGEPPARPTTNTDFLDVSVWEASSGDVLLGRGESVSFYNGNLRVGHPSSATLPLDGNLSMGLTRFYNSKRVGRDIVDCSGSTEKVVSGESWVGLGWTSHLGRVYFRPVHNPDSATSTYGAESYFEMPDGTSYRFEPTVNKAHPGLHIERIDPPPADCLETEEQQWCDLWPDDPDCGGTDPQPCAEPEDGIEPS